MENDMQGTTGDGPGRGLRAHPLADLAGRAQAMDPEEAYGMWKGGRKKVQFICSGHGSRPSRMPRVLSPWTGCWMSDAVRVCSPGT